MSKVEQMKAELQKLTPSELLEIRNWLDGMLEDQLKFTDEFEAQITQSEREMAEGVPARAYHGSAMKRNAASRRRAS